MEIGDCWFLYPPNVAHYSLFVPRAVPPDRMLTAQIKRAKEEGKCVRCNSLALREFGMLYFFSK
jgi:hypothetical protein